MKHLQIIHAPTVGSTDVQSTMHVCATAFYFSFTAVLCGMQDASVSWSTVHILSFVRFIVAVTCFTLPGLAHYFQDQKRHMVLTSVPFGPFFELSFPVALLQDPVFVSVWPRQRLMYNVTELTWRLIDLNLPWISIDNLLV